MMTVANLAVTEFIASRARPVFALSRLARFVHSATSVKPEDSPPEALHHELQMPMGDKEAGKRLSDLRSKSVKPFSHFLTDTYGREHDYLRISVTERCNLRCTYCMPEEGVPLTSQPNLLTALEIVYLARLFVDQGVKKIRLTGGEPTVRSDFVALMHQIGELRERGLRELCITTNGITLHRHIARLLQAGLTGLNLSLDTLNPLQYQIMTRRNGFSAVMKSLEKAFELKSEGYALRVKINCVVIRGVNDHEILEFVDMTRERDLEVRFIEYMPFGGNRWTKSQLLDYEQMLRTVRIRYPTLRRMHDQANETSKTFQVPGFKGTIGFITSMTHNFCASCNRLRITADGNMKVCLHGKTEFSLRDALRMANGGLPLTARSLETIGIHENSRLLEIVERAVKRKKKAHAGLEELHKQENRPMILIEKLHLRPNPPTSHSILQRAPLNGTNSNTLLLGKRWSDPLGGICESPDATAPVLTGLRQQLLSRRFHSSRIDRSAAQLSHVNNRGEARMVDVQNKRTTARCATAEGRVTFSNPKLPQLLRTNSLEKGDVFAVARIAAIQAAKRTSELVPLCHHVSLSSVSIDIGFGERVMEPILGPSDIDACDVTTIPALRVSATVQSEGKTGVEMEALVAVHIAAATIFDMCKAVDKQMVVDGIRVVSKAGGRSGAWSSKEDKQL